MFLEYNYNQLINYINIMLFEELIKVIVPFFHPLYFKNPKKNNQIL